MTIDRTPSASPVGPVAPVRPPADQTAPRAAAQAPAAPQAPTDASAIGPEARAAAAHATFTEEFGNVPYVQNPSNPTLLTLVGGAVDRAPELAGTPLAAHIAAGHLDREDIRALQQFLVTHGHSCGPAGTDGLYGPCTNQALMDFLTGNLAGPAGTPAPPPGPVPPVPPPPAPVPPPPVPPAPLPPGPVPAGAVGLAALPPRPAGAIGGREFLEQTAHLSRAQREEAIFDQIASGNVPDFERQVSDVHVSMRTADGRTINATYHVLPDYLAIGSNDDFIRIPMDPQTAQRLADRLGCSLPTRQMVDQVYQQAAVKLPPSPLPAGPEMMSNAYYQRANDAIERQRQGLQAPLGELTAGDKKDVILSNAIAQHPGRVIIYGWHQPNGKPIQPLSWIHENTYADYSHGIRLVAGTMTVDGREMPVRDVLADPQLCRLLSDEGPIRQPGYPVP